MTTRPTAAHFAFLLALFCGSPAPAQADSDIDAQRIVELEADNARLRQELAELRLELAQLRRAMQAEEATSETAEAGAAEGDEGDRDNNAPDEETDEPRTFSSADEIYRALPVELGPARDGWSIVQRVAVGEWLAENIPGSRFEARLEVHQVTIRCDTIRKDWGVTIAFAYREMRYMGWEMDQRVSSVTLRGDSDFADRARRLEEGTRVQVTGTIRLTSWGVGQSQAHDENWKPTYCEVRLEDADVRSQHLRR